MRLPDLLPDRGTGRSHVWDGRITCGMAALGGAVMLVLAPLVQARSAMLLAGVSAILVASWALLTPAGAPSWVRSAYTATCSPVIVLATYAAESGSQLRLGPGTLLVPVLVCACLRPAREAAAQATFAQLVYGGYLLATVPASAAVVGLVATSATMALLTALICLLRDRMDALVVDLRRQATTDPLTGLRNRSGLRQAVPGGPLDGGLLLLDLDLFKRINDHSGHEVGDEVLVWLADLLVRTSESGSVVSRHGGEEFVVYLPGVRDVERLRASAERLRLAVQEDSRRRGMPLTVSIGASGDASDLDGLLRSADLELYEAKRGGRNAVRVAAG
ncbi:MAG TPA: GGDEF domain-containing protein [Actinomycetales bacterium]|jgi:diguanylate cyclase (GGDEF)-like protein